MKVYLLQHAGDADDDAKVKIVGIYRSLFEAQEARSRAVGLKGFRDEAAGFSIDPYELGVDHWRDGFVRTLGGVVGPGAKA